MPEHLEEPAVREQRARKPRRRLLRAGLWMAFGALLTVALIGATTTVLLETLEQRPQYIADWLGQQLGRTVSLRALELSWSDGAPVLRLKGLKVQAAGKQAGGLALERSEIRVDALSSLRSGSLRLSKITVSGAEIHLRKDTDGQWLVAGLGSQERYRADAVIGQTLAVIPTGAEFSLVDASLKIEGVLHNNPRGTQLAFKPVSLNLRNNAENSRLSGTIGLPGLRQPPVRFSLRWKSRSGSPVKQSRLALIVRRLPLSRIPWVAGLLDLDGLDGALGLSLDIAIRDGVPASAAGSLALQQLAMSFGPEWPAVQLSGLRSVVDFAKIPRGWRLSLLKLAIESRQQHWPQTTLSMTRIEDQLTRHERVALDQLPLAALRPLLQQLPMAAGLRQRLTTGLQNQGQLQNVELTRTRLAGEPGAAAVSLDFHDLGFRDSATGIRVVAARGSLSVFEQGGRLRIDSSEFQLPGDPKPARNRPVSATGDVRWHHADHRAVVDIDNLHIGDRTVRFDTQGRIVLATTTRNASVDLEASINDVDTDKLKPYLNSGIVSPEVAAWITSALRGGRFSHLKAQLRGELADLSELPGRITIGGRFRNVNMDYAQGWPILNGLQGKLELAAKRLHLNISKGQVLGARIQKASGVIQDVSQEAPVIRITGKVQGRSEQAAAFIAASPLKPRFSGLLNNLDLVGPADLDMELDIPLSAAPVAVRGSLDVRDNLIHVPALRTGLSKVHGELSFDTGGPKLGTLSALYLSRPIRLDLDGSVDHGAITRLTIAGRTDPTGLVRHLYNVGAINSNRLDALPLLTRLSGQTDWQVALDIPVQWATGTRLGLTVNSDLRGMALDLPAPLGKTRDAVRHLRIRTHISDQAVRSFSIDYGEQLNAALEVKPDGPHYRLSRGEIRLASGTAKLPAEAGLQVAGSLKYLSVDEWVSLLSQYQTVDTGSGTDRRAQPLAEVRTINLATGSLDALGSRFKNVQLKVAHHHNTGWKIDLQGKGLEGRIAIAEPLSDSGIQARFARLDIQPSPGNSPTADIDPRGLPPLDLIVEHLRYQDLSLGLLKLVLKPFAQGTRIQRLFVLSDAYEIVGKGDWLRRNGKTRSALRLQVNGNDFGKLLTAIGYPDTGVDGGAVDMLIQGQWPGSPFDFDTTTLHGTLHFRASNGFLRDIEPGVTGRVFGLFTLTTLPRRLLRLDFSDLFEEGLGYELLEGSFNLEAGNAYTNNLKLETDTSRVEMEGRVGLLLRDYDQVMTVTPKLSSSLPLAPLWLAEKFLNRKLINDVFAYRYTITGSWDHPKVERIRVEQPEIEHK